MRKKFALGVVAAASLFGMAVVSPAQTPTPVTVPTWRYDQTHAGANTQETLLTPANVNPSTFGKLFTLKVDSTVYPQPLYVPGLKMPDGLVHNVLFVATSNDSVYAFDADSNGGANANPLWQVSMLDGAHGATAGATAIPWADTASPDVAPTVGITGTPVINVATHTMYLVSNSKENGQYFSRLHALNILTGAEQANSPVDVNATVPGTGNGSENGQMTFSPLIQNQRPALTFYNGYVYFGYAAHGDQGKWHGWLFGYDGTTLKQTMAMCLTPNGAGAGIWGSGAGFPVDTNTGKLYIVTGNGTHITTKPFTATSEFGESVIAFTIGNGVLTPTDVFTPYNAQDLNAADLDLGSGGLLMVPDQQGSTPHLLLAAGKEGGIVTVNRDNLGGDQTKNSSNLAAVQDFPPASNPEDSDGNRNPCTTGWPILQGCGFWSTAAYWNGHVYLWPSQNYPMMFNMNSGMMDTDPESMGKVVSLFPDPTFTISANGNQDGIAWAVRSDGFGPGGTPGVLYAWDANSLTTPIYESDTNATRDSAGKPANKFAIPVVTNGKVYFATEGAINVYGLLNGVTAAAAPTFSPNGGNFTTTQTVTLASATPSAQIFYTLDGSTPTTASTEYTGPITVSTDTTLNAIASAAGYLQSPVSTANFNFTNQVPPITITPPGGTYLTAQNVTLTDTDANAKIYYTTDGTKPTANSMLYTGAIHVGVSETLTAVAIDGALANSNIATASYVIQNGGTSINFANGFSNVAGLTLNGSAKANNDTRLQLTDGGENEASSVFWNAPINVQAFTTSFEFQLSNAVNGGNGFTFTIQNNGPTALGGGSAGLGYQDIPNSVAVKFNFYNYQGEGNDSTGLYVNGQPPVNPTVDISGSGVQLNSNDGIVATLNYDGTTLSLNLKDLVTTQQFNYSWKIDIPGTIKSKTAYVGFTGGSGGLSSSQKLLTWAYATQAVPPTFTPPAGSYATAQNVVLASATTDAQIHYTTDGTTPTGGSAVYSTPIAVATSETIKALAISSTVGSSAVTSAVYTIGGTGGQTGTFSLSGSAIADFQASGQATSTITVTPQNGFTGTVKVACAVTGPAGVTDLPTCSVAQPAAITGTQVVTSQLTISTDAKVPANSYTATVTGTSGTLSQTATVNFNVTGPTANPNFTLSGTAVTVATAGTPATSTITITPSGGFTGKVNLTCAVTGSPTGANAPPTCSVAQPGAISGTQPATATLTVNTTAATTAALHDPFKHMLSLGGGGTLAALLLFCFPVRRRKWQAFFGLFLLGILVTAASGCGGGSSTTTPPTTKPGTTAGTYTITVTGTSDSLTATTPVTVKVQ